jgi:hypothetical protein
MLFHTFHAKAALLNPDMRLLSEMPLIYVDPPQNITVRGGKAFTISVKIDNAVNLYGFDITLRWNSSLLDYGSHNIHVPRDTYPDGVLWSPIWPVMDKVNETACQIAIASGNPAPSFNGSGTFFEITLVAKDEVGVGYLGFDSTYLANKPPPGHNSESIPHNVQGTWVYVIPPGARGDVDGDNDVDIYDVVAVCAAYGAKEGEDPRYQPNLDIVYDHVINIFDVVAVCADYGWKKV